MDTVRRRFNEAYYPIITHGMLVDGFDKIDVVKALGPNSIQKYLQEPIYVFGKNGWIETLKK